MSLTGYKMLTLSVRLTASRRAYMETRQAASWDDFQIEIRRIRDEYSSLAAAECRRSRLPFRPHLLFRGQSNKDWTLKTTLERKTTHRFDLSGYALLATRRVEEIESFTGKYWKTPTASSILNGLASEQGPFDVKLPCYEYLVYLRHHGFPSPLLDWTESPWIAAYFAYIDCQDNDPAVYCYIEQTTPVKGSMAGAPRIDLRGPYIRTDKRHFAQKAWYTTATRWDESAKRHYFHPHEEVFSRNDLTQDILVKIELRAGDRREALLHLDDHNINHFTLFQSETSLIKAIETRVFDIESLRPFPSDGSVYSPPGAT